MRDVIGGKGRLPLTVESFLDCVPELPEMDVRFIDNGSKDESLEYLRSVKWITLIHRDGDIKKMGSWAHGSALDIGLENTQTEFFIALHSDVIIKDASWLNKLTGPFQAFWYSPGFTNESTF